MTLASLVINTLIFFLVLNASYWRRRRDNPDYPPKPATQVYLFPLALGVVFTLIVDQFRGIVMYQMFVFLAMALLLFWIFYILPGKKS